MAAPTIRSSGYGDAADRAGRGIPGLVLVFSSGASTARALSLAGGSLELGRVEGSSGELDDGRVSRNHAVVELQRGRCVVTDLGSTNGTFVDGRRIAPQVPTPVERVVRVGAALLVPFADVSPIQRVGVRKVNGRVYGPAMQAALEEAERAARAGATLHVRGETGSGKEGIAEAFHRATGRAGPQVSVNCSTITESLAERQLFGARRGAFTGAETDAAGHIEEADGGTLFLDEIADLDVDVQAKLLRVLESKEVVRLGTSKARKVDFALCSATHKDLRALVESGRFREDLYFRTARPAVTLPALRDRPEEIPALIDHALSRRSPAQVAHVSLVELCLLRPWRGNVRELLTSIADAAARAAAARDDRVAARHLAEDAGTVFGKSTGGSLAADGLDGTASGPEPSGPSRSGPHGMPGVTDDHRPNEPRKRISRRTPEWRPRIVAALEAHANNKAAAARALGLHRTELCRLIEYFGIMTEKSPDEPNEADEPDEADEPNEADEPDTSGR